MKSKHTPGPWIVDGELIVTPGIGSHRVIANLGSRRGQLSATFDANAALIAAAPELLAALRLVLDDDRLMNAMNRDQARAILDAVARAEGGEK